MIFTETIHIHSFRKQPSKLDIKSDGAISAVAFYRTPELFVPFRFFDKLIDVLCKTARRPPLAKILQQSAQFRLILFTVGTHIIKHLNAFVIKKKSAVGGTYVTKLIDRQTSTEGILRTDKDDVALFQFGIALSSQEVIDIHKALGHLEKLTFSDFFEMLTSCNSLYYRELQHRIFKVTSKNCSF